MQTWESSTRLPKLKALAGLLSIIQTLEQTAFGCCSLTLEEKTLSSLTAQTPGLSLCQTKTPSLAVIPPFHRQSSHSWKTVPSLLTISVLQSGSPGCCLVSASWISFEHWTQSPSPPGTARRCSPVREKLLDPGTFCSLSYCGVRLF